jgi:hypothetical protein
MAIGYLGLTEACTEAELRSLGSDLGDSKEGRGRVCSVRCRLARLLDQGPGKPSTCLYKP